MDAVVEGSKALELFHQGLFDQALEKALFIAPNSLDPSASAEMYHLAGACYFQLGRHEDAVKHLHLALKLYPDNSVFFNTLGVVLRKSKLLEQSVRAYTIATRLDPTFSDAFYNYGNVLSELKLKEEAVPQFLRCIELNPTHNNAHHNLANIYRDQNKIDLALEHYVLSDNAQHHNPDMHCNWGLAYQLKERWDKAISCFEVAITQKSDHAPSYVNLGSALSVQEKFEEACSAFRRGVELDDSCNDAKFNLALTLLTIGQYHEGWKFYETRLKLPDKVISPFPDIPVWDGSLDIDGPLLVWAEQGYGDNIQFVRYIPILMEMGLDIVLSTRKPLMSLFQQCLQPSSPPIVEHKRNELKGFKFHIPLLSLPHVLGTSLHSIPRMPGYLKVPDFIPANLRFVRTPFTLNIGIVWASGVDNKDMYADKSLELECLMPLFTDYLDQNIISLHSLQVGSDAPQITPWAEHKNVYDWSQKLDTFLSTAQLISQLDLVVSVDTAVAHLAAAQDKPVWLLLQHNADFRWLRGRGDSPWYNSMSLFRQTSLGDWDSAISKLSDRLRQLLG